MIDTTLQPIRQPLRVSFDLETIGGTPEDMAAEMALDFRGETPEDEKKAAKIEEKKAEWLLKSALKNSARIICAAFVTGGKAYVFTWLPLSEADLLTLFSNGIQVSVSADEAGMLTAMNGWLDSLPIEILAAHSAYHFDMPKVRGRCARLNIHKAGVFQPHTESRIVDTMKEFTTYYCMGEKRYASLDAMCEAFGLAGKPGKGSEVAGLYAAKEWLTIIQYCVLDAVLVDQAMDKMEIHSTVLGGETL